MQRELNAILRQDYRAEAVAITVTEVRVAPDLRDARIFVAVVGDEPTGTAKLRWLKGRARAIRAELARRIVLKYLPRMEYVLDTSGVASTRVLGILDELERRKT